MFAENVMSSNVLSIKFDDETTIKDVVAKLQQSGLNDLPVVDEEGRPIGIISARSILHYALPSYATKDMVSTMQGGPDLKTLHNNLEQIFRGGIRKFIGHSFEVAKTRTPISAVAAMIVNMQGDYKDILVVNESGILVGIISAGDIICRPYFSRSSG